VRGPARTAACQLAATPLGRIEALDPVLQINTSIKEAKRGRVLLEINWYIEQENLAVRPSEAAIIAILIGARGKEYKVLSDVSIEPNGPLSGTTRVVINHEEQFTGPTDTRFVVSVALKRNGNSSGLPSRKKELVLRVNPTE
jgi:hypothetical protein